MRFIQKARLITNLSSGFLVMRIKYAITSMLASLLSLSQTQKFATDFVAIVMTIHFEI